MTAPIVAILRHQHHQVSEPFIADQATSLRGFRPLFVGRDPVPARPGADSFSVADLGRRALVSYTLTRRSAGLRRALAGREVVLLHAHFGVEGVYAVPTARALGVPLVTTLHGFDVTMSKAELLRSGKPSWMNYVLGRHGLFAAGSRFICVSEHIQRRAIAWGFPADRTIVLPMGVDVERIQPSGPVAAPRILHVARLVAKKGTEDLLRAFALVRRATPEAELSIVGDGPLRTVLGALARELDVAAAVTFHGALRHPQTLALLRESRLLCLPSVTAPSGDQEGLGMVILEAAAAAKPVVATRHGGIPEAVVDGRTGFLVAEHDVTGLAERLSGLLADPELCRRTGAAGRAMVVERFNLRRQTEQLESLYRTLL